MDNSMHMVITGPRTEPCGGSKEKSLNLSEDYLFMMYMLSHLSQSIPLMPIISSI